MKKTLKFLPSFSALFVGFIIAFLGVSKSDPIHAAEVNLKEGLTFGKKDSPIEVYFFTDWACPACRKLEEHIDQYSKVITPEAKLIFVDHVIHPETLNFLPYNLSFMIKNKPEYLKLRHMLTGISEKTGSPTEEQISTAAAKLGVKYTELNYADVAIATKYFKSLGDKFKIEGTPTLIIINSASKKGKKLVGNGEITESGIKKAIQELKSS